MTRPGHFFQRLGYENFESPRQVMGYNTPELKYSRCQTPSGLPALEFRESGENWSAPGPRNNSIATIVGAGVWFGSDGGSSTMADHIVDSDWPLRDARRRPGHLAALVWWESRRLLFNALLLTTAIPGLLLLLLISWIRVTVFRMASGSAPFPAPVDFSRLAEVVVAVNVVYTVLSWIDAAVRSKRPYSRSCELGVWQSWVAFAIIAVAICFFASVPAALGLP